MLLNSFPEYLLNEKTFNKSYDIGGPDILTYKQMLLDLQKSGDLSEG